MNTTWKKKKDFAYDLVLQVTGVVDKYRGSMSSDRLCELAVAVAITQQFRSLSQQPELLAQANAGAVLAGMAEGMHELVHDLIKKSNPKAKPPESYL